MPPQFTQRSLSASSIDPCSVGGFRPRAFRGRPCSVERVATALANLERQISQVTSFESRMSAVEEIASRVWEAGHFSAAEATNQKVNRIPRHVEVTQNSNEILRPSASSVDGMVASGAEQMEKIRSDIFNALEVGLANIEDQCRLQNRALAEIKTMICGFACTPDPNVSKIKSSLEQIRYDLTLGRQDRISQTPRQEVAKMVDGACQTSFELEPRCAENLPLTINMQQNQPLIVGPTMSPLESTRGIEVPFAAAMGLDNQSRTVFERADTSSVKGPESLDSAENFLQHTVLPISRHVSQSVLDSLRSSFLNLQGSSLVHQSPMTNNPSRPQQPQYEQPAAITDNSANLNATNTGLADQDITHVGQIAPATIYTPRIYEQNAVIWNPLEQKCASIFKGWPL